MFEYDDIGNLSKDHVDSLDIHWNVQGKVDTVYINRAEDPQMLVFRYDGNGNRVRKEIHKYNSSATGFPNDSMRVTHYVRDAQGNIMSVYERKTIGHLTGAYIVGFYQKEVPLYGSDRIGEYRPDSLLWDQEVEISERPAYVAPPTTPTADALPENLMAVQSIQSSTTHPSVQSPVVNMHQQTLGAGDLPELSSDTLARLDGVLGVNSSSVSDVSGAVVLSFNCYRQYNGHTNMGMLVNGQGQLLQNSQGIKAVWSGQSAMMPWPGYPGKYLLFTVGPDDIVYAHKIDASSNAVLAKNLPQTGEGYGQYMLLFWPIS
ncbi:MAG: hypothetical protein K9H84_06585 [Bacteroidales bacterium]|nr:hypothetical protein [Bacteroidales bacterium]